MLKALTGTDWGQQKETIVATIDSRICYGAPIWSLNASPSSIKSLQTVQNSACRIASGCHASTPIDHLHAETKLLKVREHLDIICTQFLAVSLHPEHPSFQTVRADSGPRPMKHTLQSRYLRELRELTDDGALTEDGSIMDPAAARRQIHTRAVANSIAARADNRVLNAPAPDVAEEEQELPRKTRRTLAQLRSGECMALNSYLHKVGWSDTPLCPCCRSEEHTTQHLFDCPAHQTEREPIDLWLRPILSTDFLRTLPFMDLPETRRPPPEPPPTQDPHS